MDAEGAEAIGHETDQDDADAIDGDNSKQKFIFPNWLFPWFALVQNQSQKDVYHIGSNKILCTAFGIPKPTILEPYVSMGGIGDKIISVGIVHIAYNHTNWTYDKIAPEDKMILKINKIRVGYKFYQFFVGIGHREAEGNQKGINEIFVEKF